MTSIRYQAGDRGHYESLYVKGNHPTRRLAVWLKFNLLQPPGRPEALEGELWGVWFDGERGRQVLARQALPREAVATHYGQRSLRIGDANLELSGDTLTERAVVNDGDHRIAWNVRLQSEAPAVLLFPARWMYERAFPKKKVLTPIPRGRIDGWIEVDGERHDLAGWEGLHGHNWGQEHAHCYAYGNGLFPDGAYVEGFTARLKIGRAMSPWLSLLVVRLPGGRELPFNAPRHWLAGHSCVEDTRWQLDLPGANRTRLLLTMESAPDDMVQLIYRNPDGRPGLCRNTKFGRAKLRVEDHGRSVYQSESDRCELETFRPCRSG